MKRQLWFFSRFAVYLVINFLWPIVLLPFCKLAKWCGRPLFQFVFLVYPGTLDQVRGYAPLWYRSFAPLISIIGLARGKYPGLIVTIPWPLEELEEKHRIYKNNCLESIVRKVKKLADDIGAKAAVLAGRLPRLLLKNGSSQLPSPIVVGDMGAVYTIMTTTRLVARTKLPHLQIGVVGGYGFLGLRVVAALQKSSARVIVVDPNIELEEGGGEIRFTRDPAELVSCDLVIILTARGEQAETVIKHIRPGTTIIDDTHPQLPHRVIVALEKKGCRVVKAILTLEGEWFWPRLPKWESDWLPGCCIEAIVVAANGTPIDNQRDFETVANQIGFRPRAVSNKSEP